MLCLNGKVTDNKRQTVEMVWEAWVKKSEERENLDFSDLHKLPVTY